MADSIPSILTRLRSGRVRYLGLCNMAAWQIMKSLAVSDRRGWARFSSVQAYYTIAGRDLEREIVPLASDQQLAILPWSPLAGGLLSGKYELDEKPEKGRFSAEVGQFGDAYRAH